MTMVNEEARCLSSRLPVYIYIYIYITNYSLYNIYKFVDNK